MKLWAMPLRVTQDGWFIVKSSDKTWSTGGGNGNSLQYSCLENAMDSTAALLTHDCVFFDFWYFLFPHSSRNALIPLNYKMIYVTSILQLWSPHFLSFSDESTSPFPSLLKEIPRFHPLLFPSSFLSLTWGKGWKAVGQSLSALKVSNFLCKGVIFLLQHKMVLIQEKYWIWLTQLGFLNLH